jgi:cell division septation protein DedD
VNTPRQMQRTQGGGTLLGVLLGLGLGLIIAGIVAYFVYQTGTPFKGPTSPNPPSATLPQAGKALEPVVAAPGTVGGKIDFSKTAPGTTQPVATAEPVVEPTKAPALAPKAAKTPEPQATPPSAEIKPLFLQAGAFNNKSDAENRRAMLAMVGLEGRISEIAKDDKPMYRVRVGPFDSPEEASKARADMARNGIDAVVVK